MATELTEDVVETIKLAARKLTGWKRRLFQAETALKYCRGNPRKAERVFKLRPKSTPWSSLTRKPIPNFKLRWPSPE